MKPRRTLDWIASAAMLGAVLFTCASCQSEEAQAMKTEPMSMDRQIDLIQSNTHMSEQQKADAIAKIKALNGPKKSPGEPK